MTKCCVLFSFQVNQLLLPLLGSFQNWSAHKQEHFFGHLQSNKWIMMSVTLRYVSQGNYMDKNGNQTTEVTNLFNGPVSEKIQNWRAHSDKSWVKRLLVQCSLLIPHQLRLPSPTPYFRLWSTPFCCNQSFWAFDQWANLFRARNRTYNLLTQLLSEWAIFANYINMWHKSPVS